MGSLNTQRAERALARVQRAFRDFSSSLEAGREDVLPLAFELFESHELLSTPLYRLRGEQGPDEPLRARAEDIASQLAQELKGMQSSAAQRGPTETWLARYRRIWAEEFALFAQTAFLFLASAISGWLLAIRWPELSIVVIPQQTLESILEKKVWFHSIRENPVGDGMTIASNNIQVCIRCFMLSALGGLGGLWILILNGLMLGAMFGFCWTHGFQRELGEFVIGHGFLELSIIVASAFAGLLIGREFFRRPLRTFGSRIGDAGRRSGTVLAGTVPWLVLAAVIEAGFSPWPFYSVEVRLAVGLVAGAFFWAWTLWPASKRTT